MVELLLNSLINLFSGLADSLTKLSRVLGHLADARIDMLLHMLSDRLPAGKRIWFFLRFESTRSRQSVVARPDESFQVDAVVEELAEEGWTEPAVAEHRAAGPVAEPLAAPLPFLKIPRYPAPCNSSFLKPLEVRQSSEQTIERSLPS